MATAANKIPLGAVYGMKVESVRFISTTKKMTASDLIRELQAFPPNAVVLLSQDEEGNWFKPLANLNGGKFGVSETTDSSTHLADGDPDQLTDDRYESAGLKAGDPYIIIWPHG